MRVHLIGRGHQRHSSMKRPTSGSYPFSVLVYLVLLQCMAVHEAAASNSTISFLIEPRDKEVRPDDFTMMKCKVSNASLNRPLHVVWTRNDRAILQDREPIDGSVEQRFRGVGYRQMHNLAIEPVAVEDHGSYFSCRVYDGSLKDGEPTLLMESRSATLTVIYPPPAKFPQCRVSTSERKSEVDVTLSCCTEIVSVPLSLSWMAQGENSSWRLTHRASTGYETGENCVDMNIHDGLNFSLYQCKLQDASGKLESMGIWQCKIAELTPTDISLRFLDHKQALFNCTMPRSGNYRYLWHLQDQEKKQVQQVGSVSKESSLILELSKISNGSYLSCSVFEGNSMGTTDLKIVRSTPPPVAGNPTVLIIAVVIGTVVGILIFGLSTYFLIIKWRRRNERLYASLTRGSESGLHVGPGNTYIFHRNGVNGNVSGTVGSAEGEMLEADPEEIPPKPGGHRTISWEPEDIVIGSNGGVINHSEDPKKRNVEGLVYADLAFQGVDEEQDAEVEREGEQEEAVRGAVGGDLASNGTCPPKNIEYARIVPPPRSLRF